MSSLKEDWGETPILPVASDFVSAALTLGRFDVATVAAEFILAEVAATPSARAVAELYMSRGAPSDRNRHRAGADRAAPSHETGAFLEQLRQGIAQAKRQLIGYPQNPVLWSNLALLYTSLGFHDKADRAMRTALALAPENRFILRSASRFYLHSGDWHRAHCILADSPTVRADPWILSAEIATAAAVRRTSRNIKAARRLLEARRHPPFHLSELASALGTLESLSGNMKAARPLVEHSLIDPAENSIAQAAWLHRNVGGIGRETGGTSSFEANAWFACRASRWESALLETKRWLLEQPFSSRPAAFGSFVASVALGDYTEAASLAKLGLLGNPEDFALQNNTAYCLALSGDVEEAARTIRRVNQGRINDHERVALTATRGLIEFRAGNTEAGRHLYREAIALGHSLGAPSEHVARLHYAIEELRAGDPEGEMVRRETLENSAAHLGSAYRRLIERLRGARPGAL